jgi:hypothetical protein
MLPECGQRRRQARRVSYSSRFYQDWIGCRFRELPNVFSLGFLAPAV